MGTLSQTACSSQLACISSALDCWFGSANMCGAMCVLQTVPHTCKGWRSWNLFAQQNDDASMRAMMHAFVDKSRSVDGKPTSLAEVGYISVGMVRHQAIIIRYAAVLQHLLAFKSPFLLLLIVSLLRMTGFRCGPSSTAPYAAPHGLYLLT